MILAVFKLLTSICHHMSYDINHTDKYLKWTLPVFTSVILELERADREYLHCLTSSRLDNHLQCMHTSVIATQSAQTDTHTQPSKVYWNRAKTQFSTNVFWYG